MLAALIAVFQGGLQPIDSTTTKAHRLAAGEKEGANLPAAGHSRRECGTKIHLVLVTNAGVVGRRARQEGSQELGRLAEGMPGAEFGLQPA